ncbi:unnamed protein product, partial [Phaeothamnion confervicola]
LIIARYSRRKSREHLLFEAAEMQRLMQPRLVEIGYMNPRRWDQVAATYAQAGMMPASYTLDGFLFRPQQGIDWAPLYRIGAVAVIVLLIAGVVVVVLVRLNLRLSQEVKDRREVQGALRSSEQRLRTLIEGAPLAMVIWDKRRQITGWNKQAQEVFGWSQSEVQGRDFLTFMVPQDVRPQVSKVIADVIELGIESHAVNSNLTKDGRTIEVEWHNTV